MTEAERARKLREMVGLKTASAVNKAVADDKVTPTEEKKIADTLQTSKEHGAPFKENPAWDAPPPPKTETEEAVFTPGGPTVSTGSEGFRASMSGGETTEQYFARMKAQEEAKAKTEAPPKTETPASPPPADSSATLGADGLKGTTDDTLDAGKNPILDDLEPVAGSNKPETAIRHDGIEVFASGPYAGREVPEGYAYDIEHDRPIYPLGWEDSIKGEAGAGDETRSYRKLKGGGFGYVRNPKSAASVFKHVHYGPSIRVGMFNKPHESDTVYDNEADFYASLKDITEPTDFIHHFVETEDPTAEMELTGDKTVEEPEFNTSIDPTAPSIASASLKGKTDRIASMQLSTWKRMKPISDQASFDAYMQAFRDAYAGKEIVPGYDRLERTKLPNTEERNPLGVYLDAWTTGNEFIEQEAAEHGDETRAAQEKQRLNELMRHYLMNDSNIPDDAKEQMLNNFAASDIAIDETLKAIKAANAKIDAAKLAGFNKTATVNQQAAQAKVAEFQRAVDKLVTLSADMSDEAIVSVIRTMSDGRPKRVFINAINSGASAQDALKAMQEDLNQAVADEETKTRNIGRGTTTNPRSAFAKTAEPAAAPAVDPYASIMGGAASSVQGADKLRKLRIQGGNALVRDVAKAVRDGRYPQYDPMKHGTPEAYAQKLVRDAAIKKAQQLQGVTVNVYR